MSRRAVYALALMCAATPMASHSGHGRLALVEGRQAQGNVERGKQIYLKYGCYQCHGREAQGASTGPRLGPDPWPFAAFLQYTRAPRADMPPYTAKVVSDAELVDVYAFVASRPRLLARPGLLARP